MGTWSARRLAGLGAFAVVVLWVVGFFLAGKPPKFAAEPIKVAAYFHDHHKQTLIASVMVAIGIAIYIAVLAQLRVELRGAGQRTFASIVGLAASSSAAVFAIGDALYGTMGQAAAFPGGDPGLLRALYQLDQFADVPMYWLVLVVVVSVSISSTRDAYPRWTLWPNALFGILIVLGGISVKADGVFAAGTGLFASLAFIAALAFLLEIGLVLWSAKDRQITA